MQPYLFPYAGYFRLLALADHFVLYDCVQFPRRGRVHRCEVPGPTAAVEWLTLPLARQPRDVLIRDLAFAPAARTTWDARLARLPWLHSANGPGAERVRELLFGPLPSVIDYLESSLRLVAELLRLQVAITRSSTLRIGRSLHGQERVIAIARSVGATSYVNAPGGRGLYDAQDFAASGLELVFLPEYTGRFRYLLPALMSCPLDEIASDVHRRWEPRR
jgi:hypothetical protein